MTKQSIRSFLRRACQRCGGDAFLDQSDDPEWRCLQCGRLVPALTLPDQDVRPLVVRPAA